MQERVLYHFIQFVGHVTFFNFSKILDLKKDYCQDQQKLGMTHDRQIE